MAFISKIKAGEFNQRIIFKEKTYTHDGFGGVTIVESKVATVRANKKVKLF